MTRTAVGAEELGLLGEIHAGPRDDAPRLVYADWLEEHGRPEYAGFIRLQLRHKDAVIYGEEKRHYCSGASVDVAGARNVQLVGAKRSDAVEARAVVSSIVLDVLKAACGLASETLEQSPLAGAQRREVGPSRGATPEGRGTTRGPRGFSWRGRGRWWPGCWPRTAPPTA